MNKWLENRKSTYGVSLVSSTFRTYFLLNLMENAVVYNIKLSDIKNRRYNIIKKESNE